MSGLPTRLAVPQMREEEVVAALIGAWQLELCATYHPDGSVTYPFGEDAKGQIMYSADGHMGCEITATNRPLLDVQTIYHATDEELGRSMRGFSGYFGTFSVDAAAGIVTHHVQGAWFPNFATMQQPRHYFFEGDLLYLEAMVGDDLARLTWRRRNSGTLPGH